MPRCATPQVVATAGPDSSRLGLNKTYAEHDGLANTGEEVKALTAPVVIFVAPSDYAFPESLIAVVTVSGAPARS